MLTRVLIISMLLISGNTLFCQSFNIDLKGHAAGMPGNEYSDVWGYVDSQGQEYAIIGSALAINIYNVTDCSNPVLVQSYIDGANAIWRDYKTYGHYVYGVCDHTSGRPCYSGLQIINMNTLSYTNQTNVFTSAHNIFVDTAHARLYVVGSNIGGMLIYSLSNPANPVLIRHFPTSYIHDLYVRNNIVYASHGYNGYYIWDATNVNNIQLLASIDVTPGYNHSSWLNNAGTHAFSAEEVPRGLPIRVYEISGTGPGTSINYVHSFKEPLEVNDTGCRPHNPFVKGDSLFISYYEDGLQVFDISNPLQPKRIAWFDSYTAHNGQGYNLPQHDWKGHWGTYPFLPSGCILMSDITQGLYTLKLKVPADTSGAVSKVIDARYSGAYFNNPSKGIVLMSPKGDCYRIKAMPNGSIGAERIVCYLPNQQYTELHDNDFALTDPRRKLVLKDSNGTCRSLKVNLSGSLYGNAESYCPENEEATIKWDNTDLCIRSFTKGIILRGDNDLCYKIRVNNAGVLTVTQLADCP